MASGFDFGALGRRGVRGIGPDPMVPRVRDREHLSSAVTWRPRRVPLGSRARCPPEGLTAHRAASRRPREGPNRGTRGSGGMWHSGRTERRTTHARPQADHHDPQVAAHRDRPADRSPRGRGRGDRALPSRLVRASTRPGSREAILAEEPVTEAWRAANPDKLRTADEIDAQLAEERESWGDVG